jgi:sigma-B regulation protein RsbU (phosphoserine phosphatase)
MGLLTTILAGMFAMTYARHLSKRLWVAVAVGTVVMIGTRPVFTMQQFFPASSGAALAAVAVLAFGCAMVFVKYGPLAQFVAVFVYVVFISAYPLVLTGNSSHAAIGAWTLLLACAPAGLAAYNAVRPKTQTASTSVPAHVRRALDRLRIGEEFDIARRVQAQLLPNGPPDAAGLDVAGVCVPANEVGGDYYDYFRSDGGPLAVAVGDVSGKGVGAAIYMTLTKSYMVTQTARAADPVRLLSRVNEHLRRNLARGTFVTMAYAVFDVDGRRLTYTRAGHNSPLHVRANGEGDFLTAPGIALGAANSATFEAITRVESVDLQSGDLVLLYTDGVTEAMNTSLDEYGDERLVTLARRLASTGASAQAVVDALLKDVREFAGRAPQHDDITIVAVRVR